MIGVVARGPRSPAESNPPGLPVEVFTRRPRRSTHRRRARRRVAVPGVSRRFTRCRVPVEDARVDHRVAVDREGGSRHRGRWSRGRRRRPRRYPPPEQRALAARPRSSRRGASAAPMTSTPVRSARSRVAGGIASDQCDALEFASAPCAVEVMRPTSPIRGRWADSRAVDVRDEELPISLLTRGGRCLGRHGSPPGGVRRTCLRHGGRDPSGRRQWCSPRRAHCRRETGLLGRSPRWRT